MRKIFHPFVFKNSVRLKKALSRTDFLFSATPLSQKQFLEVHHKNSFYLPENAILKMQTDRPRIFDGGYLQLIWIGDVNSRKALILLLEALTKLSTDARDRIRLTVLGDGSERKRLENYCRSQKLEEVVSFKGKVDRSQVASFLSKAHLHVITSLSEASTTVIWEAMANAVPTLSLDHCGMAGILCENCGIKVPILSYDQVVGDIAKHLSEILQNPEKIEELSRGVLKCSEKFLWNERRMEIFNSAYRKVLEKRNHAANE